jgi:hypothetical protein
MKLDDVFSHYQERFQEKLFKHDFDHFRTLGDSIASGGSDFYGVGFEITLGQWSIEYRMPPDTFFLSGRSEGFSVPLEGFYQNRYSEETVKLIKDYYFSLFKSDEIQKCAKEWIERKKTLKDICQSYQLKFSLTEVEGPEWTLFQTASSGSELNYTHKYHKQDLIRLGNCILHVENRYIEIVEMTGTGTKSKRVKGGSVHAFIKEMLNCRDTAEKTVNHLWRAQ